MFNSILLPVELSSEGTWRKALPAAQTLLDDAGTLHVLSVFPDMSLVAPYFDEGFERRALEDLGRSLLEWVEAHAPGAKAHTRNGRIYTEIINTAKDVAAEAIVMASHRPDVTDYLLGANASRVVNLAKQSVFVVRD